MEGAGAAAPAAAGRLASRDRRSASGGGSADVPGARRTDSLRELAVAAIVRGGADDQEGAGAVQLIAREADGVRASRESAPGADGCGRVPRDAGSARRRVRARSSSVTSRTRSCCWSCWPIVSETELNSAPHRLEGAGQLPAVARETESQVAFAVRAEVHARHAADPALGNQVLGHRPRERVLARRRARPTPGRSGGTRRTRRAAARR